MRSMVLVLAAACGGSGSKDETTTTFIERYAAAVGTIDKLCMKRSEERLDKTLDATKEQAYALAMARAARAVELPPAPASLATCRSVALGAFAAVSAAYAPVEEKAKGEVSGHVTAAVWREAQPTFEAALKAVQAAWTGCKADAKAAGLDHIELLSPYFVIGC